MDESGQINVNSSSIIDLKAELYRKQESFKLAKLSKEQNQINEDDNDLYLNRSSNQKYKLGKRMRDNVNLQERRKRDNEKPNEKDDQQRIEEEKALKKSREMLELKTKLYEQKCKMKSNDDEDENELINFEQKAIEEKLKLRRLEEQKLQKDQVSDDDDDDDDEWTEFTDSLGRSRRCLKKDLEYLKRIDRETFGLRNNELKTSSSQMFDSYKQNFMNFNRNNELLSDDLKRELDRRDWESDAHEMNEKLNNEQYEHDDDDDEHAKEGKQHGPTHYQNVQHNEIRDHGVAYYAFDQNEQKRQEQMHLLNSLREQTVNQKQARQKLKEKRKSMMRERLMKIAQRKGIKINALPSESSSSSSSEDEVNTKEDVEWAKTTDDGMMQPERPVHEPRAKIREWDIGKDQLEKSYQQQRSTPTRFRHEDYIENRRNERLKEFAPPSTYSIQNSKDLKHDLKYNKKTKNKDQNKTIEKVKVNFETSLNDDNKSWYIDKGKQINFQSHSSERPNHNQSQTSTPSTSSTSIDCKFDVQNQITNLLHHYKRST